jgi:hypothetical protein
MPMVVKSLAQVLVVVLAGMVVLRSTSRACSSLGQERLRYCSAGSRRNWPTMVLVIARQ